MDIKRFLEFNNDGLEYFRCNSCNSVYPHFKPKNFNCKYCQSKDVVGISEDDFFLEMEMKTDPDEFRELLKHRGDLQNLELNLKYPIRASHYLTDDNRLNWISKG